MTQKRFNKLVKALRHRLIAQNKRVNKDYTFQSSHLEERLNPCFDSYEESWECVKLILDDLDEDLRLVCKENK